MARALHVRDKPATLHAELLSLVDALLGRPQPLQVLLHLHSSQLRQPHEPQIKQSTDADNRLYMGWFGVCMIPLLLTATSVFIIGFNAAAP
jgi:hypothetical protein